MKIVAINTHSIQINVTYSIQINHLSPILSFIYCHYNRFTLNRVTIWGLVYSTSQQNDLVVRRANYRSYATGSIHGWSRSHLTYVQGGC